jgi:hypothetical protein
MQQEYMLPGAMPRHGNRGLLAVESAAKVSVAGHSADKAGEVRLL